MLPKLRPYDKLLVERGYAMNFVDIVDRWGKYVEGEAIRVGGKEWGIVYVMVHHESGSAWIVLKSMAADGMYEYDIDYEQGLQKGEKDNGTGNM